MPQRHSRSPGRAARLTGAGAALLLLAAGCRGAAEPASSGLPVVEVRFGSRSVRAEVASTPEQRQTGLMNRRSLPADAGMLFLFPAPQGPDRGFWMKNTLIPLSIAYLTREASGYRVVALRDMTPCRTETCPVYNPGTPYDAALEVNRGWYRKAKVGMGDAARVRGRVPQAR